MAGKSGRQLAIMRAVAVTLLVVAFYCAAEWVQMGWTLEAGARAEAQLDAATSDLNAALAEFRGDPEDARAVLSVIELNGVDLRAATTDVAKIEDAILPIGSDGRSEYAAALTARIEAQEGYMADLSSSASKIIGRGDIIQRLSDGFGVLDELSAPELDAEKVGAVMDDVQSAVDEALEGLRSMDATGVAAYSSGPLVERLTAVSREVSGTRTALGEQDAEGFAAATAAFAELLKADWQALFFAADTAGIERLAGSVSGISELQEEAVRTRGQIATLRDSMGLAALLSAAVGALLAAMVWLR
ncbi:MAG: hypothetical protein ACYCXR_07690 [Coriobacteriia bacterium]